MNKTVSRLALILSLVCICASCSDKPRTIDNPIISASNTRTIDITSVSLSDSATVITVDAHYTPGAWLKFAGTTHLVAGDKSYEITAIDGAELDKEFWMPENGHAQFKLTFEPLPLSTTHFDFIEGDTPGAFKLWDIDLTGKGFPAYPAGLPDQLKKQPADGEMPLPVFALGETTLNIHLLNNRADYGNNWTMFINTMAGTQDQTSFTTDDNGEATVKFDQYGTAEIILLNDNSRANATIFTDPGETVNVYIDMNITGAFAMSPRGVDKVRNQWAYSDGKYADLQNFIAKNSIYKYGLNTYDASLADYHMTGDQYFDTISKLYLDKCDSIANDKLPQMLKEYAMAELQNNFIEAIASYRFILEMNYRMVNDAWSERKLPEDSIPAKLTDSHYRKAAQMLDLSDNRLLIADNKLGILDWTPYGATSDLSKSLYMYKHMADRAAKMLLSSDDLDSLRSLSNPFFAVACDSMMQRAVRTDSINRQLDLVQPTPDVADDKVFDAIVAPHRGKVVVVDLWNTWCGPCRSALKSNEPLKSGELADDDIVWIYIADESSPSPKYYSMIPDIKGLHYRLSEKQISAIQSRFEVDGIPYYILVDRNGKATGRPDFRNHSTYVSTIKEALK